MNKIYIGIQIILLFIISVACGGNEEIFYGKWIITEEIASGTVTEFDNDQINSFIGKEIIYSANEVRTDETNLQTPHYIKTRKSDAQFSQDAYVKITDLGIKKDSIIEVDIFSDELQKDYWFYMGGTFYLTDNKDEMILIFGNVYFRMERI